MMWARGFGPGFGPGFGHVFGIGGFFMIFQMLIFWALIIFGIIVAVRYLNRHNAVLAQGNRPRSLDVLQERYARGEINKEEYETKKKDLTS